MKFLHKKLLIFDLDGTLIDSVPDLAVAVNHMLTHLGKKPFKEDVIRYWVGNGAQMLVKRALLGKSQLNEEIDTALFEEALEIFLHFYRHNLCKTTQAYPHVRDSLDALKAHGYTLAIVTNKPYNFVAPILKGLNLENLFELILGGDSLEKKKPDPLPLEHVCDTLNISREASVMIGDSNNDILAANACGMESIGVSYGYNYGESISFYKPRAVVDDFADILKLLVPEK